LGGRQALYERLIKSFTLDAPAEMEALHRHLRQASVPDAVRALHTLRGLAGAVGANALAALAGAQESATRREGDLAPVDVEALQRLLDQSLAALVQTAPPAPANAAAQELDPLEALRRLRQLLVERNMRSVTACEQLAAHQGASLGPEFASLNTAVGRLDFGKALKACDQLLDRLNPR